MRETADTDLTELDSSIAHLRTDFSALAPSEAVRNVQYWIEALADADRVEFRQISDGLAELRRLLTTFPLNGKAIGNIMVRLGEDTLKVVPAAPAGAGNRLNTLANLLVTVGNTIAGS